MVASHSANFFAVGRGSSETVICRSRTNCLRYALMTVVSGTPSALATRFASSRRALFVLIISVVSIYYKYSFSIFFVKLQWVLRKCYGGDNSSAFLLTKTPTNRHWGRKTIWHGASVV